MNSLKRTLFFLNILFFAYGVSLAQTNKVIRIVRNGSIFNSNFLTIQSAVDAAIWKDEIEISGSFNEYVHIKNKQYLTIKNINGTTATITSSFLLQSSNYDYDDYDNYYQSYFSSGFNYKMFSNKIKRKAAILAVRNDRTSNNLFTTYNTKEALWELANGDGIYHDYLNQSIYLRLRNNIPANIAGGITVGNSEAIFCVENSNNIKLQGLNIENAGWAGVYILGGQANHHITFDKLNIRNCFRGITTDINPNLQSPSEETGPDTLVPYEIKVVNCKIENNADPNFTRNFAYNPNIGGSTYDPIYEEEYSPQRSKGIYIRGHYVLIYNNHIKGFFDGITYQGSNTNIANNTIELIFDDGVELESGVSSDVKFYANYIFNTFVGVSLVSQSPGRISVYRNVVECTRFDRLDGSGQCIKMGVNWGCKAQNVRIYHNTLFGGKTSVYEQVGKYYNDNTGKGYDQNPAKLCDNASNDLWTDFRFINNIFFVHNSYTNQKPTNGKSFLDGLNYNFRGKVKLPKSNFYNPANNDDQRAFNSESGTNIWEGNLYNKKQMVENEVHAVHGLESGNFFQETDLKKSETQKRILKLDDGLNNDNVYKGSWYAYDNTYTDVVTYDRLGNRPVKGAYEFDKAYTIGVYEFNGLHYHVPNSSFRESVDENLLSFLDDSKSSPTIYPNPAKNHVTISLENVGMNGGNVVITDLLGKSSNEFSYVEGTTTLTIDLSNLHLAAGIYLVKNNNNVIGKFVKQE